MSKKKFLKFDSQFGADDPRRSLIAKRCLEKYSRIAPMAAVGNIFNASVICVFAYGTAPLSALGAWLAAIAFFVALRLVGARRSRQRLEHDLPEDITFSVVATSGVLGVFWGAMIAWMLSASSVSPLIPSMVAAGMMSAASLTLNVFPRAAFAFIAPVALGGAFGFITLGSADGYAALALLTSYCFVLWRAVAASYTSFIDRTHKEYELTEQADTVALLLHAYQEHSADWLWLVDDDGRLSEISPRFAEAAQRPAEILAGRHLVDLFDDCPELERLREHIATRSSFSNLTLPLTIGGDQHWWTLSAHLRLAADRKTVIGLRGVAANVTAARRAEAKVAYLAHYDGLTDLPNRFLFNETLQRVMRIRQAGQTSAVLCLDLDQFKAVNDTLGHPVGDQLLVTVARRIESAIGERDIAARLGGDEFAVLLPNVESRDAARVTAERIIAAVSEPVEIDGHRIVSATSIGIALAPQDGDTVAELLKNADLALYDAKGNGRGRFSYFSMDMHETARERRELEMDLRTALAKGQLRLHYQPFVNIETNDISGYEALMRWSHPTRGAVPPAQFIPIAEEIGLITQLGEWVIREAVAEVARWHEPLHVAVNLSPAQMRSPSLISTVVNALATSGVAAHRLELEITESVLMQDSETNIATLHHLRDLGVRISLDDFGTGYSSLNYLRCFPFDKIKIDRCFVEGIDDNPDCRAIVSSVASLAKELGMTTTAEGVERPAQLAALLEGACTEAQGFLFSKAVPPEELTDLRPKTPVYPEIGEAVMFGVAEERRAIGIMRQQRAS